MKGLPETEVRRAVRLALEEDVGSGDATTLATMPSDLMAVALMRAREPMCVAGLDLAAAAFGEAEVERRVQDGQQVPAKAVLMKLTGRAQALLSAERVALNFVQRLSGIATLTARFVEQTSGTRAKILDTRKTTPGWRAMEKYAVQCGGGANHRVGLFDMILIKDNHLAALAGEKPDAITAAVRRAREKYPDLKVEVEADTLEQVRQAVTAGADIVRLDNMGLDELRAAVKLCDGRLKTEASGGVNLDTVRAIAETGVDYISVGALTHSARAMDIGLDFE